MKIALVEMKIGNVPSRPQGVGMWALVFAWFFLFAQEDSGDLLRAEP
jgi:hypothetical protein